MRQSDTGKLRLSATDLAGHLACHHLTALDLASASGEVAPPPWNNPVLAAIQERGLEHEARYLEELQAQGRELRDLSGETDRGTGALRTEEAMRAGESAIVQATLVSAHIAFFSIKNG